MCSPADSWQVGSRLVLQMTGVLMLILGIFGKFGAVFITIPEPVIGGMFLVMFGMIAAVGISNLQVNLLTTDTYYLIQCSMFLTEDIRNLWTGAIGNGWRETVLI